MKIAICDDEKIFAERIYQYLWRQLDCAVEYFLSPEPLLEKYRAGVRYDVVFTDILMEPYNGIELGRRIRAYDNRVFLVFLTSSLEYAPLGYEVKAFRYLLKPVSREDVFHVLKDIRTELQGSGKILMSLPEGELLLDLHRVIYLEANDKETAVYSEDDMLIVRKGLNELETLFAAGDFFRIHRKYLVNLDHVREVDENRLTLDCGQSLPVSRRKSKEFRDALQFFLEGGIYG